MLAPTPTPSPTPTPWQVGYLFPLLMFEACGRPKGRLLCGALALLWLFILALLAAQFTQYEQAPEPPWAFVNAANETVLGVGVGVGIGVGVANPTQP